MIEICCFKTTKSYQILCFWSFVIIIKIFVFCSGKTSLTIIGQYLNSVVAPEMIIDVWQKGTHRGFFREVS